MIAWADDVPSSAASLRDRFPDHDVLELAVTPHGAL